MNTTPPNLDTSDQSQLEQAQAAFARGDYASARRLAAPLVSASSPLAEEARALLVRLTPHRLTKLFFALTLLLLCVVTAFAYSQ